MQHHFIQIIEEIDLYRPLDTTKKGKKLQCPFDLQIAELSAKISKRLFDATSLHPNCFILTHIG